MKYRLTVPCHRSKLKTIRDFVDKTLSQYSISEVDLNLLILAVDEICANLVIHSYHDSERVNDCIELQIRVEEDKGITFEIIDKKNEGFSLKTYQEPVIQDLIKAKRKGGIGLMLVHRIMDEVEFKSNGHGNVCKLYKELALA